LTDGPINANPRMLSLIGDIYDTTFDQALWNDTLKRLTDYAGAQSCGLVTQSATEGLLVSHNVGCDPQYLRTYIDQYWQFDPTQAIRLCDVGRIHRTEDWISFEDIRTSLFYQEWARPSAWWMPRSCCSTIPPTASPISA